MNFVKRIDICPRCRNREQRGSERICKVHGLSTCAPLRLKYTSNYGGQEIYNPVHRKRCEWLKDCIRRRRISEALVTVNDSFLKAITGNLLQYFRDDYISRCVRSSYVHISLDRSETNESIKSGKNNAFGQRNVFTSQLTGNVTRRMYPSYAWDPCMV